MTWAIGPVSATEIDVVLDLWRIAEAPASVPDTADAVRVLVANDAGSLLVAREDGAVIGSVIAAWDGWRGAMYRLAVRPDRRRLGVASALVRAAEQHLESLGARRIAAVVVDSNHVASAFWRAAGYRLAHDQARMVRNP